MKIFAIIGAGIAAAAAVIFTGVCLYKKNEIDESQLDVNPDEAETVYVSSDEMVN